MANLPSSVSTVKGLLESKKHELAQALPSQIPVDKLIRVMVNVVSKNYELQKCSQQSLIGALLESCLDGLEPNGKEAAIIPYKGTATYQPMVQGIMKLARNSGEIKDMYSEVVYECDQFEISHGLDRELTHIPDLTHQDYGEDSKVIGAYAVYVLKDGTKSFQYMTKKQIEKRHAVSKQKAGGIWDKWYAEKCKVTVMKSLLKTAPRSSEKHMTMDNYDPGKIFNTLELPTPQEQAEASIDAPKRLSETTVEPENVVPVGDEQVNTETGEVIENTETKDFSEEDTKQGDFLNGVDNVGN